MEIMSEETQKPQPEDPEAKRDPKKQPEEKEEKKIALSQAEYELLKEQAQKGQEFYDKYLRAYAEAENVRKRMVKEKSELARYTTENLVLAILPMVDNLDRALDSLKPTQESSAVIEGIELIRKQLHDFLDKQGVSPMTSVGEKFDPYLHEALMEVPSSEVSEGTVIEEIQKGYRLHERVIRPAVVKIAKKPEATQTEQKPKEETSS